LVKVIARISISFWRELLCDFAVTDWNYAGVGIECCLLVHWCRQDVWRISRDNAAVTWYSLSASRWHATVARSLTYCPNAAADLVVGH